jgi:hypothetical protein
VKAKRAVPDRINFQCPGAVENRTLSLTRRGGWTFNGDFERPTFSPSVLVMSGHYAPDWKSGDNCWCTYNAEDPDEPSPFKCRRCHSFVRDDQIQFLADSSHGFAGQTVELPEWRIS